LQYIERYITTIGKSYLDYVTVTTKAMSLTFTKIPVRFADIDLSNNNFEGEIPNVVGEFEGREIWIWLKTSGYRIWMWSIIWS